MKKQKWTTDNPPKDYSNCKTEQLKNIIQDLNDEYITKIKNGKNNPFWERLISKQLESVREELEKRKKSWFSMNNPIVYIIVILVLAFIAYITCKFKFPLKF